MCKGDLKRHRVRAYPNAQAMSRNILTILLIAILPTFYSCAALPQQSITQIEEARAEQVLATLHKKEADILSLKAIFRVDIHGAGFPISKKIDGVLLYQRPNMIRLKGFSPLGGLIFDFLVGGERYTLRFPKKNLMFAGKAGDFSGGEETRMLVQLSLRAMAILLGKVVMAEDRKVDFIEDGDQYLIKVLSSPPGGGYVSEKIIRQIWIDRHDLQVNEFNDLSLDGEVVAIVQATDFWIVRDASMPENLSIILPYKIVADDRLGEGVMSLKFQEIIVNDNLEIREFSHTQF